MKRLEGKVALVTGAARGQGRAHATTLAREGADIIALDISEQIDTVQFPLATAEDLAETAAQVEQLDRRILAEDADVRSQEDMDRVVAKGLAEFGQIDIVIANAGIWSIRPFWELSDAEWQDMIDVNLTGVWRTVKAVTPHLIERRSGSIVMTGSTNAIMPGYDYAHYTASKHGVLGLMKTVALELARFGIRCNAVCPGTTDSPMINNQMMYDMIAGREGGTREDLLAGATAYHALDGVTAIPPQAIADAALWLSSDEAANVTGITVPVDAGHLIMAGIRPDW
jgi:SDR family mycofactocin-dependent oxidoreductase